MPTGSEAARAARVEAGRWMEIAAAGELEFADIPPTEAAVVGYFDPGADLQRRASEWNHVLPDQTLPSLARFAAGMALAEADAWDGDDPSTATMAYEQRRFLLGDRILHWAVPWLDQMGRCYHDRRETLHTARDHLLVLGDRHRPAPVLVEGEGLTLPGEDSLGRTALDEDLDRWLRSIWSGILITDATVRSMTGDITANRNHSLTGIPLLSDYYAIAANRWESLASDHPGSARLWLDLAARARRTTLRLEAGRLT